MLKKVVCLCLSVMLILISTVTVQASDATASLKISKEIAKPGDTFSVVLSVSCADGINGVTGIEYNYDTDILELTGSEVSDSAFINIGSSQIIDLISSSSNKITSSDIYVFNFKVKDSAKSGDTAKITIKNILVDSDAATDSETEIKTLTTTIKIESNSSNEEGTSENDSSNKTGDEKENNNSNKIEDEKENDNSNKIEDEKVGNDLNKTENEKVSNNLDKSEESNINSKSEKNDSESDVSKNQLPKTGSTLGLGFIVIILIGISIICYIRYKRYKSVE